MEQEGKLSVTKQARRSDSLMYDEWVSRQTLCDMVARTECERDEARAVAKELYRALELMEPLAAIRMRDAAREAGVDV